MAICEALWRFRFATRRQEILDSGRYQQRWFLRGAGDVLNWAPATSLRGDSGYLTEPAEVITSHLPPPPVPPQPPAQHKQSQATTKKESAKSKQLIAAIDR